MEICKSLAIGFGLLTCALFLVSSPAHAQLVSPGDLSSAHAAFEGVTNCTTCHEFGRVGITNDKCLSCHTPLQEQLEDNLGLHAKTADQNCGACHKDHFGRDFDVLRFEPASFDHAETVYPLVGAHIDVDCRGCHQPALIASPTVRSFKAEHDALDKTWLGLTATCATCHTSEPAHGDQFADSDCASCHTEEIWTDLAPFDHAGTDFPLTGRHTDVACESCHKPLDDQPSIVHFENVPAQTCESCHTDVHNDALDANCTTCHITDGWEVFTADFPTAAFNHDLTDFPLVGQHTEVACSNCHQQPATNTPDIQITLQSGSLHATFPDPLFENCMSCHTDNFHGDVFDTSVGGAVCSNCHSEAGWSPTSYDLTRHNEETDFALTGAHLAIPCIACHQNPDLGQSELAFHFENQECQTCHAPANPHGGQFDNEDGGSNCSTCHGAESWALDGTFDHTDTRFPLTGQHLNTSCESCHTTATLADGVEAQLFRGTDNTCISCHTDDNPHGNQFETQTCNTCHDATSFFVESFDHNTTQFSLEGAHETVACGSCHFEEQPVNEPAFIRYKPLKMECQDCHDDIN